METRTARRTLDAKEGEENDVILVDREDGV